MCSVYNLCCLRIGLTVGPQAGAKQGHTPMQALSCRLSKNKCFSSSTPFSIFPMLRSQGELPDSLFTLSLFPIHQLFLLLLLHLPFRLCFWHHSPIFFGQTSALISPCCLPSLYLLTCSPHHFKSWLGQGSIHFYWPYSTICLQGGIGFLKDKLIKSDLCTWITWSILAGLLY